MNNFDFPITRTDTPVPKPDMDKLGFGQYFTDHMFVMDFDDGTGWHNARIVPYAPISLDPAAAVLHYSQEVFEGMKAYLTRSGDALLFRPFENAQRSNNSSRRLCMPVIDERLYIEAIKALVREDYDWIPDREGTALYIRPFIIATEAFLGVRPSKKYSFYVIMSPVGSYYESGLMPTKIYVEDEYARSVKGGMGAAKTGGNYASGLLSQEKAKAKNCSQVLWLDGVERKYVEEIGTSNAFFAIEDKIVTSPLTGTILPGITRDSVIELLRSWDMRVEEDRFTIGDIFEAHENGRLSEVFATGTAAVISPVGQIMWGERSITINENTTGPISKRLYESITGIQTGMIADRFSWTELIPKP
ncbi:MAG: branched-chain amino acid aminotransferase [Clostridiales Family XIII bacterium]|jgi:branched-chain amino acid aminotransferase|nr:branched-chain amino acid aminotransferase [Clostridiales Family XIII bacterium]